MSHTHQSERVAIVTGAADTDIFTSAAETSRSRSSWTPDLGPRNVYRLYKPRILYFMMSGAVRLEPHFALAAITSGSVNEAVSK